jgi:hypothetical protein
LPDILSRAIAVRLARRSSNANGIRLQPDAALTLPNPQGKEGLRMSVEPNERDNQENLDRIHRLILSYLRELAPYVPIVVALIAILAAII